MKKIRLFLTGLLCVISGWAFAQNITVAGAVTDASTGETIAAATVQLKGSSTKYALTDNLGNYTISIPGNSILVVSYLGYKTQEVPVNNRTTLNIRLEAEMESLDDVIVVAYGTVKREAKTGAVSSVKGNSIGEAPVSSVDKMLAGKMAGVQISSYSGQPGAPTTIRIRGISSINAGSEPLWVVDGIPVIADDLSQMSNVGSGSGTTMAAINPNDIESITVLKDAAAASIYGSRAANGVILVTTKSGKEGKSRFTARAKFGASTLANDNHYGVMNGRDLLDYQRVSIKNAGLNPDDPKKSYYRPESLLDGQLTDWMDHFTKTGTLQEYEINATGGTSKSSYYSSLSYHKNEGVYYGVDYQRFTARINADFQLLKSLKTGTKINFSYSDSNSPQMGSLYYSNPAYAGLNILPWTPAYNEDGTHNTQINENSNANPRANAEYDEYNDKQYRMQGSMYLQWNPIKKITIKTTNGAEGNFMDSRQLWAAETNQGEATLWTYRNKDYRLTTSNTITYDDVFADKHSLRVLVGQEAQFDHSDYLGAKSPKVDPLIPYPPTSSAKDDQAYFGLSEESMMSFFGILDYSFDSRYYLQASVRYDGSSLFGSENKWGLFWSVGASWNINKEKWLKDVSWLDALKLRASYGVNGNNNISRYRAYGIYETTQYNGFVGMRPSRPENANLSWERNKTWNIGLDFSFLGRINGSVDFYNRLTTDMLLYQKVPQTTGFSSTLKNVGSIRNRGVEVMLEGDIIRTKDVVWNLGGNISFNRTKVLDLAGSTFLDVLDPRSDGSTPVRIVEGMNLYNFYIRDWYGVNPSTGDGLFWTEDNKLTSDRTKARYIYAGSPEPKFTGGFNTSVTWKGLTLSAFFEFSYGNKAMVGNTSISDGENISVNSNTIMLDYWKQPGDTGVLPKPVYGSGKTYYASYSTRFMEDASYLRIKDITLAYSLPTNILSKTKIQGVKFYVSALNPYTFHDVTLMDPELGTLGYNTGAIYSMVKSFIGGVEISF
ncbi:MAG: TonB-dependent receptor [Bacteroidales bacterium]